LVSQKKAHFPTNFLAIPQVSVEEAVAVTHQDILAEVGLLQSLEFLVKMHQFRMLTCCTSSLGGGGRSAVQLVNGTDAVDAAGGGGGEIVI
jgi:hypothetical protein